MSDKYQIAIPPELNPRKPFKYEGAVLVRSDTYVDAEQNSYRPGQQIKFNLPALMSDFRDMTVQFSIDAVPGTGGTFTRFNSDIASIFQRVRVIFGSTTVADIDNYNLIHNIMQTTNPVDYASSTGVILEGTGGAAARNADYLNANRVYAVNLRCLELFKYILPLQKVASQMQIIITLAQPNVCIETDHTDTTPITYTVNRPQIHYSVLTMTDMWENAYDNFISANGGYDIVFRSFGDYLNSAAFQATNTRVQQQLPFRYNSLLALVYVMRNNADVEDFTVLNKLNSFNYNALDSQRFRINSTYYPLDASRSLADYMTTFMDCWDINYKSDFAGAANFGSNTFVGSHFVGRHPKDNRDMVALNGLQTSTSGTSIIADFNFAAPLPSTQLTNFFAWHEVYLTFRPNGSVEFTE